VAAAVLRYTIKGTIRALVLTVKPGPDRSMLLLERVFLVTRVKITTSKGNCQYGSKRETCKVA
jgi:hypothetical protein